MSLTKMCCVKTFVTILCIGSVISQIKLKNGVPHVKLRIGELVGRTAISRDGNQYSSFEGIRYATVCRRFEPPESLSDETWTNIKEAIEPGPKCSQLNSFSDLISGEEDCLYLNVHVPTTAIKDPLPVMIFFHGGAYREGEGDSYGPQYFMDTNVILVTLNYRLGPLGFLSTGDGVVPGNMGMKDQVSGLKWVHEHVGSFGGDTSRITLFGQSAGAGSAHLHMFSPMSKGLFHRVILQSGTATAVWSWNRRDTSVLLAKQIGEHLKCPTTDNMELVECLRSVKVEDLLIAQKEFIRWHRYPISIFKSTIEDLDSISENSFLLDTPESLLERNEYHKVPIIAGITKDEGLLFHSVEVRLDKELTHDLNTNWDKVAPVSFQFIDAIQERDLNIVSQKLRKFYFGDHQISLNGFQNLTNICSDAFFVYDLLNNVRLHAQSVDVYLYILAYQGEFSLTSYHGDGQNFGVSHCDDVQYFFNSSAYSPKVPAARGSPSDKFSRNILKLWASFARTGKPSDTWGSINKWQPISKSEAAGKTPFKYLELDANPKIVQSPFQERYEVWEKIFRRHGVKQSLEMSIDSRDEF